MCIRESWFGDTHTYKMIQRIIQVDYITHQFTCIRLFVSKSNIKISNHNRYIRQWVRGYKHVLCSDSCLLVVEGVLSVWKNLAVYVCTHPVHYYVYV